MTISLCMIVRNEQEVLARCLESVQGAADEIIIVDTGSTDATEEIARRYTERVYFFPWQENFSAARNFSFSKAQKEYCMWMDADDVLEQEDREALIRLKAQLPQDVDVVMMRYHAAFDEQGRAVFSYYRERIVRNNAEYRWKGRVHETIEPKGNVVYSEIAVSHKKTHPGTPGRNLRIYEAQKAAGEAFSPRDEFYYGRELYYNAKYPQAIHVLSHFLEEGEGWVENNIEACRTLSLCYQAQKERKKARQALFRSLEYGEPRAEICCDIGALLMEEERYRDAIYWYELALSRKRQDDSGAFILPECYGYLPCIQLCVCYDRLGEFQKARDFNEKAGRFKPESQAYQFNKAYYQKIFPKPEKNSMHSSAEDGI